MFFLKRNVSDKKSEDGFGQIFLIRGSATCFFSKNPQEGREIEGKAYFAVLFVICVRGNQTTDVTD